MPAGATAEMRRAGPDRLEEENDDLVILDGNTIVDCIAQGLSGPGMH